MRTKIIAIINTSPDSFSGDGMSSDALIEKRIEQAINEGADILDIGGQSTRPGAEIISEADEIARVVPAIRRARELTDMPISVDTFKPAVAEAALRAGATILNDIHGGEDQAMVELVKSHDADLVVMHSRGMPDTMSQLTDYPDGVVEAVMEFLKQRTDALIEAGVKPEKIIIDPGIGFAKTAAQSFELTKSLDRCMSLGFRVLYGASRKSFIGKALANEAGEPLPVEERLSATTATTTYACLQGVAIIRVHDVKAAVEARRIVACINEPSLAA